MSRQTNRSRRVKSWLRDKLTRGGYYVAPASDPEQVDRLIRRLRPEAVAQPLIRLGAPTSDGGYLVPDDLEGIRFAISPGVAQEVSFDVDLAERGIRVVMLDASVKGPPIDRPEFDFRPLFLDTYESERTTTLQSLVDDLPGDADLLLEMDIEGAEYRVLHSASSELLRRFRIIVIEFHDLADLASRSRCPDLAAALDKLFDTHRVVHVHPNNHGRTMRLAGHEFSEVLEVTFHRRDRSDSVHGARVPLPHPLDQDCDPQSAPSPIPAAWRS